MMHNKYVLAVVGLLALGLVVITFDELSGTVKETVKKLLFK